MGASGWEGRDEGGHPEELPRLCNPMDAAKRCQARQPSASKSAHSPDGDALNLVHHAHRRAVHGADGQVGRLDLPHRLGLKPHVGDQRLAVAAGKAGRGGAQREGLGGGKIVGACGECGSVCAACALAVSCASGVARGLAGWLTGSRSGAVGWCSPSCCQPAA